MGMGNGNRGAPGVGRVMVATDRSETADRAVRWAAAFANRYEAELLLLQVVLPSNPGVTETGQAEATRATFAAQELKQFAEELAGPRGRSRVVMDDDPARAILQVAEEADVDTLVVGNAGMSGRKEFLLGNVPNRISHNARCTLIIVNTALLDSDGSQRAPSMPGTARGGRLSRDAEKEVEPHLMGRATRIGSVMAKHGLKELFTRSDPDTDANRRRQAQRVRGAMEELGPTFAKLGQILSTRPDLLPAEFIEELASLQDNVPPLNEAQVVAVMEEELGVPWEDVFESIEATPMAAGTIAEVHRATLADGSRVVVKVQRPTAREDIMQDLALLQLFAEKTEHRPAFRQVIDMPAVFEHLSDSLRRELDFRQEAGNIDRMRQVLEPYARLEVPGVHHDLSSSRLLVMEEIQGGPIRTAPEGPERREAARQLLESYYAQILTEGFFHADPHPGNLMWWNDKIYFLDFGMVGQIGPDVRENLMLLLMAFWQEDVQFLTDVTLMLAGGADRADLDIQAFQEELGAVMARYRNVSLREIQLGPILQEITEISIRHNVPLPATLALTGKAMAQMQLATAELDPEIDPFEVAGSYLMRGVTRRIIGRADPKKLFYEAQKVKVRLSRIAEAFERLAGARPGPKLQVNFTAERLEDTVRRVGRRIATGLIAGAGLLGAGITAASARVAQWVPISLGIVGAGFTLFLLADLLRRKR
jgi:predicted unusual protein kinase regulating ubiquinone biosynthesis (AarF/ABC1/UbiB family)/nucleotide-binding universal stress UspA family protein